MVEARTVCLGACAKQPLFECIARHVHAGGLLGQPVLAEKAEGSVEAARALTNCGVRAQCFDDQWWPL